VTVLSGATELPSILPRDGDHTLEPDVSREAAEAIHADAVRLNRSELVFIIPTFILAIAAAGATVFDPREFGVLGAAAAVLMFRVIQWGAEWARLRLSDPHRYITAEFRQETVNRQAAAAHEAQRAVTRLVVTPALIAGIAAVTAVQFFVPGVMRSIDLAALVKQSTWHGEWWRLLTASYLHGDVMHLVGNLSALFVLGGLVEMYDRRLSVPLAYLAGVIGGSLSSLLLVKGSAVGASAGILGIAGYLVVVFRRQPHSHSGWLLKRLFAMLGSVAIMGLVGFMFIDNAAHAGGLVAGAIVGLMCVPTPAATGTLRRALLVEAASWCAIVVLIAGGIFTTLRLVS